MTPQDSQEFESFVPVYDVVPENWEDARPMLVETLKKITNAVNVREIGFYLDEELLSGKQFIPSVSMSGTDSSNSQQFRTILRKVIDVGPLTVGANSFAHGITVDSNFTLIDMWVSATRSATPIAQIITGNDVTLDATNVNITSPGAFNRAYCFIEYIQEL